MRKRIILRAILIMVTISFLIVILFSVNTYYNALNGMREFSALWNTTDSIIYYIKKNNEWPDSFESLSEAYSIHAHPFKNEDLLFFQKNVDINFQIDLGEIPDSADWYVRLKNGRLLQEEKDANDRIRTIMIFRLSHKLNQKIKTGTLEALTLHQTPFADWSCHIFPANRRQYILLSNTKSLYSCVMPAKSLTNQKQFAESAMNSIRDFTADDANQWAFRKFIAPEIETVQFAKSLNRSVTSSMNQLVDCAQGLLIECQMSPHEVGFKLNDFLLSSIAETKSDGYGRPEDAFKRMVERSK